MNRKQSVISKHEIMGHCALGATNFAMQCVTLETGQWLLIQQHAMHVTRAITLPYKRPCVRHICRRPITDRVDVVNESPYPTVM
ncbi:hypothetical protein WL68_01480 [Burkholderia cepacia]|nr:hypothetical protein WK70_11045 [Burkholderia cepacia]KVX57532.1 hypothetical protein WL06_08595 [Burkholderia cepacia]KWD59456.1 hypothetical protein WL68_01480 [Burkholderia cepacia]KWD71867.1 hypothetical protein WL69_35150 [Burkholderia cepacia]KWH49027.1 hypothetical protein WM00_24440 [Burkholderia cepacia]